MAKREREKVLEMAKEEVCEHEMFMVVRWKSRQLAVPLVQLEGIQLGEEEEQALEDWRYWVDQHGKW